MRPRRLEQLNAEYVGRRVVVDASRPELRRFAGRRGRVKAINYNDRALVEFEGADRAWYDIELDDLKVVDTAETSERGPAEPPASSPQQELSRLELARMQRPAKPAPPDDQ